VTREPVSYAQRFRLIRATARKNKEPRNEDFSFHSSFDAEPFSIRASHAPERTRPAGNARA
jgi:hypothetical protein